MKITNRKLSNNLILAALFRPTRLLNDKMASVKFCFCKILRTSEEAKTNKPRRADKVEPTLRRGSRAICIV